MAILAMFLFIILCSQVPSLSRFQLLSLAVLVWASLPDAECDRRIRGDHKSVSRDYIAICMAQPISFIIMY